MQGETGLGLFSRGDFLLQFLVAPGQHLGVQFQLNGSGLQLRGHGVERLGNLREFKHKVLLVQPLGQVARAYVFCRGGDVLGGGGQEAPPGKPGGCETEDAESHEPCELDVQGAPRVGIGDLFVDAHIDGRRMHHVRVHSGEGQNSFDAVRGGDFQGAFGLLVSQLYDTGFAFAGSHGVGEGRFTREHRTQVIDDGHDAVWGEHRGGELLSEPGEAHAAGECGMHFPVF